MKITITWRTTLIIACIFYVISLITNDGFTMCLGLAFAIVTVPLEIISRFDEGE